MNWSAMSDHDKLVWSAGLLEGEGWFTVIQPPGNRRPQLRVGIKMCDRDAVERVGAVFPGHTSMYVSHNDNPAHNDTHRYVWCGQCAQEVMLAVLPFMCARRTEQIEAALATPGLSHNQKETT